MKQEEELLMKDLGARLLYMPMVEYKGETYNVLGITHGRLVLCKPFMSHTLDECPLVEEVKPYLFPLSSMTKEQWDNGSRVNLTEFTFDSLECGCFTIASYTCENDLPDLLEFINWLIENHFDIYGLIPKGLAIDATGLNIY
jgi:hypothetical protein